MNIIREMLSGPNGKLSSMRVMSFLCLLQAFFYLDFQVLQDRPVDVTTLLSLLGVAVGGKLGQRLAEGKAKEVKG